MIVLPKIFAACFTLIFALLSSLGAVSPRQSAWALDLPVYQFLKEPLTRRFGEAWYQELCDVADELRSQGYL